MTPEKFHHLLEANRILSSTLQQGALLRQVMRYAAEVVEAETCSLLLYDERAGELVFDLALTDKEQVLKEIRLKMGEGIAGATAQERKAQIVNDVARDSRWTSRADSRTKFVTRSVLAVPLLYGERLLGVVEAINKKAGDFTATDAEVLEAFAAQAAISIENARNFERLHEEKRKLEAVFSQMSDGVIFVDPAGKKLLWNRAAASLLGEEAVYRATLPEVFAGFSSTPPLEELIAGRERSVAVEFARTAGKALFLAGVATKIVDAHDAIQGMIILFRDVTLEKKESMVKRNFLSLVSHKLKTPLVAITGYGPLLLADQNLTDFQKKAIASISRQGNYLASLVDKLLSFTIIESDEVTLERATQRLGPIVERALASLRPYLEEHGAVVTVDGNIASLEPVEADADKVEAVIRNLVENAVKFNPAERKTVEISAARRDGCAGLAVKDNGPGIPPEEREKIFQRFYQIEESFTGQVEGAGLGLALVKNVVEAHRGILQLETAVGGGSTFRFFLPLARKE